MPSSIDAPSTTSTPRTVPACTHRRGRLELFDTIVLSAHEGTVDKVELCAIALDRLGGWDVSSALLIDNKADQVCGFEQAGGHGYVFVDDATFLTDVSAGRLPASLRP